MEQIGTARRGLASRWLGAVVAAAVFGTFTTLANPQVHRSPATLDWLILLPVILATSIGGWIVGPRVAKTGVSRGAILRMAFACYLLLFILLPLVPAILAAPVVMDGGSIPCVRIDWGFTNAIQNPCPSGFSGAGALNMLAQEAFASYLVELVAFVLLFPALIVLLIALSAAWAWLLDFQYRAEDQIGRFRRAQPDVDVGPPTTS